MAGLLIPSWYHSEKPNQLEMNIVSIIFGFSMGCSIFTASMAIKHFWVFFFIIVTWSMQIQFTLQIIINRISLLLGNKTNINRVKWTVAVIATLINISGFCIWIPARLQISPLYEHINIVWDRTEKGIFLIVDLALNLYFIHLVRSRLIACGLTKYIKLFHFNVAMVVISVSLDCVLMGATFLPSPVVYVQFHQLVYLLKLYIEMNVASLLGHIVKSSRDPDTSGTAGRSHVQRVREELAGARMTTLISANRNGHIRLDDMSSGNSRCERPEWESGIVKKVETQIVVTDTPYKNDNQYTRDGLFKTNSPYPKSDSDDNMS
ncbi:glutathione s-transferase [Fusarium austroafricanum]|uniref:Glutathione s-transferase n=1 Tax=Fusarium austroafricanum TaxID=2364996 RepID=A0A8H4KD32_9HYPO|nr:glutathione s-transferase [Fusarium austroafricanum]